MPFLLLQMLHHLADFPRKLTQHSHAVYEYVACPPVGYPELTDEIWCHRYYLRNLCDGGRFPEWPITDHVQLLQVCSSWPLCRSYTLVLCVSCGWPCCRVHGQVGVRQRTVQS